MCQYSAFSFSQAGCPQRECCSLRFCCVCYTFRPCQHVDPAAVYQSLSVFHTAAECPIANGMVCGGQGICGNDKNIMAPVSRAGSRRCWTSATTDATCTLTCSRVAERMPLHNCRHHQTSITIYCSTSCINCSVASATTALWSPTARAYGTPSQRARSLVSYCACCYYRVGRCRCWSILVHPWWKRPDPQVQGQLMLLHRPSTLSRRCDCRIHHRRPPGRRRVSRRMVAVRGTQELWRCRTRGCWW